MKDAVVLVVVALVSIVLGAVAEVTLMTALPPSIDAVGNYFLLIVPVATAVVVLLGYLVLRGPLRRAPLGIALLYALVFAAGQFAMTTSLLNPLQDRLSYLAITLVLTLLATWWARSRTVSTVPPQQA